MSVKSNSRSPAPEARQKAHGETVGQVVKTI
jgi:hypothetical protein